MTKVFSGGGKSSSSVAADNLIAVDSAEIVMALCEGPIVGPAEGWKSVYFDDTRILNASGEYNFQCTALQYTTGEFDDTITFALGGETRSSSVGVQLRQGDSIVRRTQTGELAAIEIRLMIQALYNSEDLGDDSVDAEFQIEWKALSGTTWFSRTTTISGKTTSNSYVKDYVLQVDSTVTDPWEIRVTLLSDTDGDIVITAYWESFQEVGVASRSYPDVALLHMVFSAEEVPNIPEIRGVYKGLVVRVPANYDPDTREYVGVWDGTFKFAWTNNPAWVLYDLVMNDRYGLRRYDPSLSCNKWDFYEAAVWCDELVDDGYGGTEPRYTYNGLLTDQSLGMEVARYIAGSFNAAIWDDLTGEIRLTVDKPGEAVALFTRQNVVGGKFTYSWTDLSTRYNDITVTFKNAKYDWVQDWFNITDDTEILKYGRIPLDFTAVGAITLTEAIRRAQYKLYTATKETMAVTFKTNRQGLYVRPFDLILVGDESMAWSVDRRIKTLSEDRTTITFRDALYLSAGSEDWVFKIPGGVYLAKPTSTVTNSYGGIIEATFSPPLPENMPAEAVVSVGTPRVFRVTRMEEADGADQVEISGYLTDSSKWENVDSLAGVNLPADTTGSTGGDPTTSTVNTTPPALSCPTFTQEVTRDDEHKLTITIDWASSGYSEWNYTYKVYSRPAASTSEEEWDQREVVNNVIWNHPAGAYNFKIVPYSIYGSRPAWEDIPSCPFTVQFCSSNKEGGIGVVHSGQAVLLDNGSCTGYNIQLYWASDIDYQGKLFKQYELQIINKDTGELLRTEILSEPQYLYLYFDQLKDLNQSPTPTAFTFQIRLMDICGQYTPWYVIDQNYKSCVAQTIEVIHKYVDDNNARDDAQDQAITDNNARDDAQDQAITDNNARDDAQDQAIADTQQAVSGLGATIINLGDTVQQIQQTLAEPISLTDTLSANCEVIKNPRLEAFSETVLTLTGASLMLDLSKANNFVVKLTAGAVTTIQFTGGCSGGKPIKVVVQQPSTTPTSISFAGVKWKTRTAPSQTMTPNAIDMYVFFDYGGTVGILGASAGKDFG